jgi:hypothetical protein
MKWVHTSSANVSNDALCNEEHCGEHDNAFVGGNYRGRSIVIHKRATNHPRHYATPHVGSSTNVTLTRMFKNTSKSPARQPTNYLA